MKFLVIPVLLIALVVGATTWYAIGTHKTQAQSACPAPPQQRSDFRFADASSLGTPKISEATAIRVAKDSAGTLWDKPQVTTQAQFVVFSDGGRFRRVPAWVVTFCGVDYYPPIPFHLRDQPIAKMALHEWNVVLNAETGKYMEEFAFR